MESMTNIHTKIPETGFLRLHQIIGDPRKNLPPILPIGRTSFLQKVKDGVYPKPVRISKRIVAWRVEGILKLIEDIGGEKTS